MKLQTKAMREARFALSHKRLFPKHTENKRAKARELVPMLVALRALAN